MIHVFPVNDLKEHDIESTQCTCIPQIIIEPDCDMIVIHNSFDGRENNEWVEQKMPNSED
jgi:hypothetical protein